MALAEATGEGRVKCQTLADLAAWLHAICESYGLRRQALGHQKRQTAGTFLTLVETPRPCRARALHRMQLCLAESPLLQSPGNHVNIPCLDLLTCNKGTVIVQVQRVGECIRDVTCVQNVCPH